MPRLIYKPRQDVDEYLIFSTIVDRPVSPVLTRQQMFERITLEGYGGRYNFAHTAEQAEASLNRADANGTSELAPLGREPYPLWDEEHLLHNLPEPFGIRWCAHRDLAALTRALEAGDTHRIGLITEEITND